MKDAFPLLPPAEARDAFVEFPALGPHINVLMVWPKFPPSYWGFEGAIQIMPERALMPPLALITIAAMLPAGWSVRLIDCAFEELLDSDILEADLVMLSGMHVQRSGIRSVLARCRALQRRTVMGGPYASSQPEELLRLADHVIAGEAEDIFDQLASDLEAGRARRLYQAPDKPDVRRTPIPRFDLIRHEKYAAMPVQFSRGCPFQCEFCDIITIYGRRPRTKTPAQVLCELDVLYRLGWRKLVFVVDDNFIGNHRAALELCSELAQWQRERNYPFTLFTEASIDLSQRRELMAAMAAANFLLVFIGIETPHAESLREAKKFQNLRQDPLEQIRIIQHSGLMVTAGFIVGFDSDDASIFRRQHEFIEDAAIPWAMVNLLQALPTTPLRARMEAEGRLLDNDAISYAGDLPNFQTVLPFETLFGGTATLLRELYDPERYFARASRALTAWSPLHAGHLQRRDLESLLRSFWFQGVRSDYRGAYWRFLANAIRRWWREPSRLMFALFLAVSAHHLLTFAAEYATRLDQQKLQPQRSSDRMAIPASQGTR